jgi:hypothetical protein
MSDTLWHLAIYVYDGPAPPVGWPTAISLCVPGRSTRGQLTELPSAVTCPDCRSWCEFLKLTDEIWRDAQEASPAE